MVEGVLSPALLKIRRERARELAEELARETRIPAVDILGRSRDPQVVAVRHRLWSMLHDSGLSYFALAQVLDFEHSSIIYGVKKVRAAQREFALTEAKVAS